MSIKNQQTIYNAPSVYKLGGGGDAPADWYGSYKWNGNASWSYNGNDISFEQALFDNGLGLGALRIFNQIDLSAKKIIEFGMKVYLQRKTGINSATAVLFDCQSVSGVANNKIRLAKIEFDGGVNDVTKIKLYIPRDNNQWSNAIEIPIDVPIDVEIKLLFDYQQNKFTYNVNGFEGEDLITITTPPTNFCPCYFLKNQNFQLNTFSYPYLWFYEKMYLQGTYLKADNKIVYGCE